MIYIDKYLKIVTSTFNCSLLTFDFQYHLYTPSDMESETSPEQLKFSKKDTWVISGAYWSMIKLAGWRAMQVRLPMLTLFAISRRHDAPPNHRTFFSVGTRWRQSSCRPDYQRFHSQGGGVGTYWGRTYANLFPPAQLVGLLESRMRSGSNFNLV